MADAEREEAGGGQVTRVLARVAAGEREAFSKLWDLVYPQLENLADRLLGNERPTHTLEAAALVHEVYLTLQRRKGLEWENRRHFHRAAAAIMRSFLVNHARNRNRLKKGGGAKKLVWDDDFARVEARAMDLVALDESLERLEEIDSRQAQLVELRFFAGLSVDETAAALGVSRRTVFTDWNLARAWLLRDIERDSNA